ncbi:MAG: tRNA (cytidine(34)-2'-O)-methyltransferase [Tepidisphaeraceae bacterium]
MAHDTVIHLPQHHLELAIVRPQIAPNTGNIARLCVATGTELHLVRPMGFVLTDRQIKRSAMDYWPRLKLTVHDDEAAFLKAMAGVRLWMFTSKSQQDLWQAGFQDGDCLVFGSETHGLSDELLAVCPEHNVRIPQVEGERCLNLATAAGIGLYQALGRVASK